MNEIGEQKFVTDGVVLAISLVEMGQAEIFPCFDERRGGGAASATTYPILRGVTSFTAAVTRHKYVIRNFSKLIPIICFYGKQIRFPGKVLPSQA